MVRCKVGVIAFQGMDTLKSISSKINSFYIALIMLMIGMFDYKLIEAFAAVLLEGGFDKAAMCLNITQSAVSQRVKLLEDQAGRILVVRSSPPAATPAGAQILKHYVQVKRLEDELQESLHKPEGPEGFQVIPIGINEDSLATWFYPAVEPFLASGRVLLDIHADDQEETYKMLRDGLVAGCISSRNKPVQGCRITPIGSMTYRMMAAPVFVDRFFCSGFDSNSLMLAPAVIFSRKDTLHDAFLTQVLGFSVSRYPAHYLPSSEVFVDCIASGTAYGMLPDYQTESLVNEGRLVNLFPEQSLSVNLYWHCWNLKSELLETLSQLIISGFSKSKLK